MTATPALLGAAVHCGAKAMPRSVPAAILADVGSALTTGKTSLCAPTRVGGLHLWAIGYATVDVVADCTFTLPSEAGFQERELLFDNVLVGDYEIVDPRQSSAHGEPMVHVRAVPEGGPAGARRGTNLPFPFYDRFATATTRGFDRRQPLPSTFAARYIESGTSGFNTNFLIWREGVTGAGAACSEYRANSTIAHRELFHRRVPRQRLFAGGLGDDHRARRHEPHRAAAVISGSYHSRRM